MSLGYWIGAWVAVTIIWVLWHRFLSHYWDGLHAMHGDFATYGPWTDQQWRIYTGTAWFLYTIWFVVGCFVPAMRPPWPPWS